MSWLRADVKRPRLNARKRRRNRERERRAAEQEAAALAAPAPALTDQPRRGIIMRVLGAIR